MQLFLAAFQWNQQVSVGDAAAVLGLFATALGLVFTGLQMRNATLQQRTQTLLDLSERYFADSEVRKFYYRLDYQQFVFDPTAFAGSDEERYLDSLLYTFDVIGRAVQNKAITAAETATFAFQAARVLNNSEVRRYLSWLNAEYERLGRPAPAHADAIYLIKTISTPA